MSDSKDVMSCIKSLLKSLDHTEDVIDVDELLVMDLEDFIVKFAPYGVRFVNANEKPKPRSVLTDEEEEDWEDTHPAKKPKPKRTGYMVIQKNDPAFKGVDEYLSIDQRGEAIWDSDPCVADIYDTKKSADAARIRHGNDNRHGFLKPKVILVSDARW